MSNLSPASVLVDADGNQLAVDDGVAIPANTPSLLSTGKDGSTARVMRVGSDGTVRVDPTGTTTQPVSDGGGSLTIDATSLPLPTGAATSANQTSGDQKSVVRGGAKGATTAADVTSTAEGSDHQALDVQIYHAGTAKDPTQIRALTSSDVVDVSDRAARKVGQAFLRNPGDSANMGDVTTPVRVDPVGVTEQPIAADEVSDYAPAPSGVIGAAVRLTADPSRQLAVRGPILTDEETFRDDFSGSSLTTALTGTVTVTNGSTLVTGSGTTFTTQLDTLKHIRLSAHADSALSRIARIVSDTQLELEAGYTGASGSGAAVWSYWVPSVPTGASVVITNSLAQITASMTNGHRVSIERDTDYLPLSVMFTATGVGTDVNRVVVLGLEDELGSAEARAVFIFGAIPTEVLCVSAWAADSYEETQAAFPGSATTSTANTYEIIISADSVAFKINDVQITNHRIHVPPPYARMKAVAYTLNTATPVVGHTMDVDVVFVQSHNNVDVTKPLTVEGAAGGQPIIVQFGSAGGGTSLPQMINLVFSKTEGAIVANTFKRALSYTVPTGYNGFIIKFVSFQDEVGVSRFVAERHLANFNNNTQVTTLVSSYLAPQFVGQVQAEVTTAFAAGAGNVVLSVQYVSDNGTTRTRTITIPKGSVVGSRWDLDIHPNDNGVQEILSITGTPTQVGVVKILGLMNLIVHLDQSTTMQTETLFAPGAITFPAGTVLGIEYSGGTVAKARFFDTLIQLVQ